MIGNSGFFWGGVGGIRCVMRTTNMGQDAITIKLLLEPWGRGGVGIWTQVLPIKKIGSLDSVIESQGSCNKIYLVELATFTKNFTISLHLYRITSPK